MLDDSVANTGNAHPILGLKYAQTWRNWVLESINTQQQADGIQTFSSGSIPSENITIRDGVVIQPPGGYFGIIVNMSQSGAHSASNQYPNITARNFTWRGGGGSGGSIQSGATGGENAGNLAKAGLFPLVTGHIMWSETPGTPGYFTDYYAESTGVNPPVAGTYTTADYNVRWNMATGAGGTYYKYSGTGVYTNAPGTNDITMNPRLADATRNILKWGQSIDPSITTYTQVLDRLSAAADDTGYDSRFNITALLKWTRWGHVPQEPRLWTACNGSYCGGVDPAPLRNAAAAAAAAAF
jgi:hypothetical protein